MPSRQAGLSGNQGSPSRGPDAHGTTEDGSSDGSSDGASATMTQPAAELHGALPIRSRTQSSSDVPSGRRHRDRRAHNRRVHHKGGRGNGSSGGGHRRDSKLGPSTPRRGSATQKTNSTRKMRSWLAAFTGTTTATAPSQVRPRKGNRTGSSGGSKGADKDTTKSKAASPTDGPRPPPRRLGKAELGKYADEEHMPEKVAAYLQNGWGVRREGIIPVLGALLEQSRQTEYAYLCDPCVEHVSRLPKEGPFCGYRNIQTLFSYIVSAGLPGHDRFGGALPSIFDVQDLIENAWDNGFNQQGRVETGGVRGTRKYIGTSEAVAVFQSLGVPISVRALSGKKRGAVRDMLHKDVLQYFEQGVRAADTGKVRSTRLPPIYWQQPGHSVTIVGIERTRAGDTNLLVLDPNFMRTPLLVVLLGGQRRATTHHPDRLLQAYRRSPQNVAKFHATEILKLQPPENKAVASKTSRQEASDTVAAAKG